MRLPRSRVEVEARGHRDPGLGEDAGGERPAVVGQVADVGVDVEGAVGRRDVAEAGLRQPVEHQRPVGAVDGAVGFELLGRVERGECGHLAGVRRADEQVLHQPLDTADVRLRHHHPADAPAGHREVLGEGVDDVDLVADLQRRDRAGAVVQPVVDLVGDEADAELARPLDQRGELGARQHGAGRVGRARDQRAGEVRRQVGGARLEAVLGAGGDADRHEVERLQDVAVGRIAGLADRHPVAALEEAGEGEDEAGRRAGGDDDAAGVEVDPVPVAVEPGDAGAQLGQPERHGVAERAALHRRASAARAAAGAGVPGWPTSMWTTAAPAPPRRAPPPSRP